MLNKNDKKSGGLERNNIKRCTLAQLEQLQRLAIGTYRETFADSNSEALLTQYFEEALNLKTLREQLLETNSEFYFIYSPSSEHIEDNLAGYLKLNIDNAQTDLLDPHALEVEKIYIRQEFLNKGHGKQLIAFAIDRAKQHHKHYVWLGVWENNFSAIAFYQKMGFEHFGHHPFDMGGDIQTDLLFKKRL